MRRTLFTILGSVVLVSALGLSIAAVAVSDSPEISPVAVLAPPVLSTDVVDPEQEARSILPVVDREVPQSWLPRFYRCARQNGRRFCDGPRRVPEPHGPEAELARTLEIGNFQAARQALIRGPLATWVAAVEAPVEETLEWPVAAGRIGRGLGRPFASGREFSHNGIDIPAEPRSEVRAVAGGMVVYADNGVRGYGNLLVIVHADGSTAHYAHLFEAHVFPGQQVQRGERIALVGNTGISRGAHLHFEWRCGGVPQNPFTRLEGFPRTEEDRPLFARERPPRADAMLRGFGAETADRELPECVGERIPTIAEQREALGQ